MTDVNDPYGMDDGEDTCAAVESRNMKVKLTHVTDEDTLHGMLKDAWRKRMEEAVKPVHAVAGNYPGTKCATWPTDDVNGSPVSASGGGWGTGDQVQCRCVVHKGQHNSVRVDLQAINAHDRP